MRRMTCIVATTLVGLAPVAQAQTDKLIGTFVGTGRACSGKLVVQAKTISWMTSFSRCESLPYDVIEQFTDAETSRYSFKFKRHPHGLVAA